MTSIVTSGFESHKHLIRRKWVFALSTVAGFLTALVAWAEEPNEVEKSREDKLTARRAELMQSRISDVKVESIEPGFPAEFTLKPLFKYSDPSRGHVAGAVWKLGDEGRPKALIATELDVFSYGKPSISYELVSLTKSTFTARSSDINWAPRGTTYEFKPIPDAPAPEVSAPRRLIQMRDLLKRFASHEDVENEKCELRALTSPIDRYVPSKVKRADGAIFLLAYGTNPEVVLIMESDGQKWNFAAGRMTGAKTVILTFDDVVVWQGGPLENGRTAPFTGMNTPIDIPGFAKDGSKLKD